MLPEDPENLRRKCKSAEDLFVFTAKPKQKPKSTRKPACTLMWGDDEDDGLECDCGYGPNRNDLKSAEDVDGCMLVKPDFVEDAIGPEALTVEEVPDDGFESYAEEQVSQVRTFSKSYGVH